MPRLLLIHGNADVPTSFDPLLLLLLPEPKLCIDLEHTFNAWDNNRPVNAVEVARQLAKTYAIGPDDVVIGHSMGGWIAGHLKAETGATTILLNSWTNPRKINAPTRNLRLLRFAVNSRFYQHRVVIGLAKLIAPVWTSRQRARAALDRLAIINPAYLYWQYQIIFSPVPSPKSLPDLRIHTRRDPVIRPPDEPFVLVPGDHVAHWHHPAEVAKAINHFLAGRAVAA